MFHQSQIVCHVSQPWLFKTVINTLGDIEVAQETN